MCLSSGINQVAHKPPAGVTRNLNVRESMSVMFAHTIDWLSHFHFGMNSSTVSLLSRYHCGWVVIASRAEHAGHCMIAGSQGNNLKPGLLHLLFKVGICLQVNVLSTIMGASGNCLQCPAGMMQPALSTIPGWCTAPSIQLDCCFLSVTGYTPFGSITKQVADDITFTASDQQGGLVTLSLIIKAVSECQQPCVRHGSVLYTA